MAEYENNTGESDEWYTPLSILNTIGERYNLDPCSPGTNHWVPADVIYTKEHDGLNSQWAGFVFMNPPFGKRNGHVPWLKKFIAHGNGIGIARAYTSAKWFHNLIPQMDAILFPCGKTKFVRPDGTVGKAPGHGIVLFAIGKRGVKALKKSDLGIFIDLRKN